MTNEEKSNEEMIDKHTYIASCSFGKDSLATLILAKLNNEPLDKVVYVEVMFDNSRNISGELPEHIEWVRGFAVPRLKELFDVDVDIVRTQWDYITAFKRVCTEKSKYQGKCRGFLIGGMCRANSEGKMKEIHRYKRQFDNVVDYVGIALDEPKRLERLKGNKISLLVKYGYTEQMAYDLCKQYDLISPYYASSSRGGCWFCPNARWSQMFHIYNDYPQLWAELAELAETENMITKNFKYDMTFYNVAKRLQAQKQQLTLF